MLVCGCDDAADVWREETRKAKRAYKCEECGLTIQPGEEHSYVFLVWDGEPYQHRTCLRCAGLWESLTDLGYCWMIGALKDAYFEWLDEQTSYDEDRDEYVLGNGRTVPEQMDKIFHSPNRPAGARRQATG